MPFGICVVAIILRLLYEFFQTCEAEAHARRQRQERKDSGGMSGSAQDADGKMRGGGHFDGTA